jgi:hypothetical protein
VHCFKPRFGHRTYAEGVFFRFPVEGWTCDKSVLRTGNLVAKVAGLRVAVAATPFDEVFCGWYDIEK